MVSRTARPAAQATGLPPKVVPCWPGFSRSAARAEGDGGADRQPAAEALGEGDDVGLDALRAWCSNQWPVRPMPVWTSSRTSSVPVAAVISRAACR